MASALFWVATISSFSQYPQRPTIEVTSNGELFINGIKLVPRAEGQPPKAIEFVEKDRPEIVPISDRANLCIYRNTRVLANVRTGSPRWSCTLILTNHESTELPNFKFGGIFSIRGKRFSFLNDADMRKSNFESLLLENERSMASQKEWVFFINKTSVEISFNDLGVLVDVRVGIQRKQAED